MNKGKDAYVCERERERESESIYVCFCVYVNLKETDGKMGITVLFYVSLQNRMQIDAKKIFSYLFKIPF